MFIFLGAIAAAAPPPSSIVNISSTTCLCETNVCSNCRLATICSSNHTDSDAANPGTDAANPGPDKSAQRAAPVTIYSDECFLTGRGLSACKSHCPIKPSEGLLFLSDSCSSAQKMNCSLVMQCQNAIPYLYLPCRLNSANVSGCLYCFKEFAPGIKLPNFDSNGRVISGTSFTTANSLSTRTDTPSLTVADGASAGMPERSASSILPNSVPFVVPGLDGEDITSSRSTSSPSSQQPGSTSDAIPDPVSFNGANTSNSENTAATTILSSTLVPIFVALLVGLLMRCKRRNRNIKTIHNTELPSQDTLQDFEGALDEIVDVKPIPNWLASRSNMTDLNDKSTLLSKGISEKTIDECQEHAAEDEYQDINLLKDSSFSLSMRSILIPNIRKLKPFSAPTKELLSKTAAPDLYIPSLQIENNHVWRSMAQLESNANFQPRPSSCSQDLENCSQKDMTRVVTIERFDAPSLVSERPKYLNMVTTKKFGGFEKRDSTGISELREGDVDVLITDEDC